MKSIFDDDFVYTPSHQTDITKTFARAREEQRRNNLYDTSPSSKPVNSRTDSRSNGRVLQLSESGKDRRRPARGTRT